MSHPQAIVNDGFFVFEMPRRSAEIRLNLFPEVFPEALKAVPGFSARA
jgi:hypothetical protein